MRRSICQTRMLLTNSGGTRGVLNSRTFCVRGAGPRIHGTLWPRCTRGLRGIKVARPVLMAKPLLNVPSPSRFARAALGLCLAVATQQIRSAAHAQSSFEVAPSPEPPLRFATTHWWRIATLELGVMAAGTVWLRLTPGSHIQVTFFLSPFSTPR